MSLSLIKSWKYTRHLFEYYLFHVYWCLNFTHVCAPSAHPQNTEGVIVTTGAPGMGIIGVCVLRCGWWESNLGPLQEQVLFTSGPSLNASQNICNSKKSYLFFLVMPTGNILP